MTRTRNMHGDQQLDEIGGEALDGSGFEDETPDPSIHVLDDDARILADGRHSEERRKERGDVY